MPYFIAIDIGTTHCKAIIVNEKAETVHAFKLPVISIIDEYGRHEQDAALIFQSVLSLLQQSLHAVNKNKIAGISFSAAMHSILLLDENGELLTNAFTWADTQSKLYAQQLKSSGEAERIYLQTGTPIHAMSPLCKLLWLKNEKVKLFVKAAKFVSIKEYIFYRLFGKFIVDEGIASATGLYDIYNACWCADALKLAGIDETKLSKVVSATRIENELIHEIKTLLNIENNIPFVLGGNDGCLANLGCGALTENETALTIGTSGAVRVAIPRPSFTEAEKILKPEGKGLFKYILSKDLFVTGGPINNGGIALQWFAENFLGNAIQSAEDFDMVMTLAARAPAGADGLIFLPYLLGERAPVWDEDATAMFYGLRFMHNRAHLTRAVIEGISFSLFQILNAVEKANGAVNKVFVSGMVTKSDWWMQLLADMFGKTIVLNETADASALGAAFMGMYATGFIKDLSEVKGFLAASKSFEPDGKNHALYMQQFKLYVSLYPAFKV